MLYIVDRIMGCGQSLKITWPHISSKNALDIISFSKTDVTLLLTTKFYFIIFQNICLLFT